MYSVQKIKFPILKGAYLGQKTPGINPELFAPGIISTELHNDGGDIYWISAEIINEFKTKE